MDQSALPPLLGIVGHEIAGNPTQFAMERVLAAAGLDWRFLSFDVAPDRLPDAIRGIDALNFHGLAITPSHASQVYDLVPRRTEAAQAAEWVDILERESDGQLLAHNLMGQCLVDALGHEKIAGGTAAVLGDADKSLALMRNLLQHGLRRVLLRDSDPAPTRPPTTANLAPHSARSAPHSQPKTKQSDAAAGYAPAANVKDAAPNDAVPNDAGPGAAVRSEAEQTDGAVIDGANSKAAHTDPARPDAAQSTTQPNATQPNATQTSAPQTDAAGIERSTAGSQTDSAAPATHAGDAGVRIISGEAGVTTTSSEAGEGARQQSPMRRSPLAKADVLGTVNILIRGTIKALGNRPAPCSESLLSMLPEGCVVIDMATSAGTSPLLRFASSRGLPTISAIDLMMMRSTAAFRLWTGRQPDQQLLREAFEEYLEI
jgi:shikimate 5-dehydrogenase